MLRATQIISEGNLLGKEPFENWKENGLVEK
jgi:hypothetical protein